MDSKLRLIIQIPCLNEASTLPQTLAELPRAIPGVRSIETLVINDGSTDDTEAVARACGVDHILSFPQNRGLARAYEAGLDACLRLGADIIVNTDADNQYPGAAIPALVAPILAGRADMVVGDRRVGTVAHFSPIKRHLQRLGSRVLTALAGIPILDGTSGFRALTREAAQHVVVTNAYTATAEVLIQLGRAQLAVAWVPVMVNPPLRPSRLFRSTTVYILKQSRTMLKAAVMYRPTLPFFTLAAGAILLSAALFARFTYYHLTLEEAGHIQSVIVASTLALVALMLFVAGLLADLISKNRVLMERILIHARHLDQGTGSLVHSRHRSPPLTPQTQPLATLEREPKIQH